MLSNMTASGGQIQGARDYQEDSYCIIEKVSHQDYGALYVLADGMGGHDGGAQASELAVKGFCDSFRQSQGEIPERLSQALRAANSEIADFVTDNPDFEDMGTTLVGVYIDNSGALWWVSVGDSPLWRVHNGQITQLNDDHSMGPVFDKMVELGDMTASEAKNNPKRNALRSVVHGKDIKLVDVSAEPVQLTEGDCVILASDGVESLTEHAIQTHVEQQVMAEHLVSAILHDIDSKQLSHQDNATLIAISMPRADKSALLQPEVNTRHVAPQTQTVKSTNRHLLIVVALLLTLMVVILGAVLFGSSQDSIEPQITPPPLPSESKETTKNVPPDIDESLDEEPHEIDNESVDFEEDTIDHQVGDVPVKSEDKRQPETDAETEAKDPVVRDIEPSEANGKGESDILDADNVQQPVNTQESDDEEETCDLLLEDEQSCAQAQSNDDGTE